MDPVGAAWLVRVETPWACFGFVVTGGVVTRAAPITRWAEGRSGRGLVAYWLQRGASVTWTPTAAE